MASLLGDLRKLEKDRNEIEELKAIEQSRIVSLTDGRHPKKKRAKLKNDKILSNDIELKEIRAKIAEKEAEIERINSQLERDSQEDIDAYNNYLNELERVAKLRKNRLGKKVLTSNGDIKEYEESELDYTRITKARESFREYTNKVTPAEYLRSNRTGKRYPSIDESTVERLYREKTFNAGVVPESVFKRKKKQQEAIAKKQAQSINKNNTADTKESLSNDNIINEENQSSLNEVLDTDSNDSVWANRPSISELRDQIAMYDAQISDMHIDMDKEIERFMQSVDERIKALFEEKESARSYTNPKETKKQLDYIGELSTAVRRRFNKSVVEASIGNLSEEDLNKISEDYKKITDFLEEFEEYAQQNVSDSDKYDKLFGFFDDLSSESIESIHSEKFFNKEKIPEAIQEYIKERPERDPLLDDIKNQRNSHLEYFEELEKAAARRKDKAALDVVLGKNTFEAYKNTESDYKGISKARLEFNEYAKNTSLKDFSKDNKLAQFLETMSPTVLKSLHSQKGFDKSKIPVDILGLFFGKEGKENKLVDSNKFDRNQRNRPTAASPAAVALKLIAFIVAITATALKILLSILNKLDNLGKKTIESDLEFHKTLINSTTRFGYDRAGRVLGIDGNRFVNMVTDFRESFNPLTGVDETKLRNLAILLHRENDTGAIAESVTNFTTPQEYLSYLMDILDRQYKEITSIKDPNERASVLNQKIQLMEKFSPDMAAILGAMYAQNYTEGPYQGMIKSVDDLFRIANLHSQTNSVNAYENALRNLSKAIDELMAKFKMNFADLVAGIARGFTGLIEKITALLPDEREAVGKTLETAKSNQELVTERKKQIEHIKKGSGEQAEKAVKEAGFTKKEGAFFRKEVPIPVEDIMTIFEAAGTNLISPIYNKRKLALRSKDVQSKMEALLRKRFEDQLREQKKAQGLDGDFTTKDLKDINTKVKNERNRLNNLYNYLMQKDSIYDLAANEGAISEFLVAVDMQERIAEREAYPVSYKAKDFSNETMAMQARSLQEVAKDRELRDKIVTNNLVIPKAKIPIDEILEAHGKEVSDALLEMKPEAALGYLAGKSEDIGYLNKIREQFFSEDALKKAGRSGQSFETLAAALPYLREIEVLNDGIQDFFIGALLGNKINTSLFLNRLIVNAVGRVTDKESAEKTARMLLNELLGSEKAEIKGSDRGVVEYKGAPNSNVVFTIKLMQGDKVVYEDRYGSDIQTGVNQTIEGQVNLDLNEKVE